MNQAELDVLGVQEAEARLQRALRIGDVAERPPHHRIGAEGAGEYARHRIELAWGRGLNSRQSR